MKKLSVILLAICMCITGILFAGCNQGNPPDDKPGQDPNLIPAMPSVQSEGLIYELNEDGTSYMMTGCGTCNDANIRIADEYKGLPVTKISASAFAMTPHPYFVSLTLGKNIKEIDDWAFDNLTSEHFATFYVPEENTEFTVIDNTLYTKDVSRLIRYAPGQTESSFIIPDSVTEIEKFAFNGNVLTNITIPEGVTSIGYHAFLNSKNLTTLSIPTSVTYIDGRISMYSSIKEFRVEENNETYKSVDGVLYSKDGTTLLDYPCGKENSFFEIPSSVTTIADSAFEYNEKITSVTFGTGVVTIGNTAFNYCSSLTAVVFPQGWNCLIESIGYSAFSNTALTSIELPWNVDVLEDFTFAGCSNLTSVKLTLNLEEIGDSVFRGCDQLTSIDFEGSTIDWTGIEKDEEWLVSSSLTKVTCNDGDIIL
ncbi:MAG: leucine-rich repeat protein [Clostridia bacterium]|nr:leucine-rich repeat protein [Clostridia bacterium]